ncbi:glycine zipper 2TM domain-containing protein [Duganella sp. CY15W]|uniref:beta/gamma crystallin-related protein n=1 Tax=Duganella sp. CY15W TaxID=2692172 RepID=UPI00136937CB|nr:beta/gamma crystallin-related protein [Duganella sp. CY15W]MYM28167.1 glycine zipper 2TM domain-containing protein [Duganella sp. CY15W]
MNKTLKIAAAIAAMGLASQAFAQITFYEGDGLRGRAYSANGQVRDLGRVGFNDRASSVFVDRGQWEVCEDSNFRGQCMVLRPGSYESLSGMGLNNRISSVRPVKARDRYDNEAPPPLAQPSYEWRRRPSERVVQVPVTSVRAVVGTPEQRCWVERQQVNEPSRPNAGGVIAGALIGGILGHQVGGGTGRDVATAGGAIAGAAVGNNVANQNNSYSRDVRRCENVSNPKPEYWDVTYNYRGVEHRVQMNTPPASNIAVNAQTGEPRM